MSICRLTVLLTCCLSLALPAAAQLASPGETALDIAFAPAQTQFLQRVVGHRISSAAAAEFLTMHEIDVTRAIPPEYQIAAVNNVNHTFDEAEYARPGVHVAVLRFRANLVSEGREHEEVVDEPDLFFTVAFEQQGDAWVKTESSAVWDIERTFPPNDMRYAMRPFSSQLGDRLNDLPAYP